MNKDIETINRNKKKSLMRFRRFNCCPFKKSIKYDKFFKEMEGMQSDEEDNENIVTATPLRRNTFQNGSFGETMSPQTRMPEAAPTMGETTFISSV
jgi:hypothetical protein